MSAPAGPFIVSQRQRVEHAADCFWNRAHPPVDGDEAACCSCGAHADAAVPLSRWAYATLEEARGCVQARLREHVPEGAPWSVAGRTYTDFDVEFGRYATADGGTIKLPDGEIVVEVTTWSELAATVLDPRTWMDPRDGRAQADVLAAWNAEYGIGEGSRR